MFSIRVDSDSPWMIRLRMADAEKLGSLRSLGALRVLVQGQVLSVRGDSMNADLARRIKAIPDVERFTIRPDGQLVRADSTVPCALVPEGLWEPLETWLQFDLPGTGFTAPSATRLMLKLIRSSSPTTANLLQTKWSTWFAYAVTAPQMRLNRWSFARSADDRVLIRGTPIPPIPGRRFVEAHAVIIPCGWGFEPNVGPQVAGQVLQLDESEMALFSEDGSFERLARSAFVQATRSAVRATDG